MNLWYPIFQLLQHRSYSLMPGWKKMYIIYRIISLIRVLWHFLTYFLLRLELGPNPLAGTGVCNVPVYLSPTKWSVLLPSVYVLLPSGMYGITTASQISAVRAVLCRIWRSYNRLNLGWAGGNCLVNGLSQWHYATARSGRVYSVPASESLLQ